jgi:hypothetical protein
MRTATAAKPGAQRAEGEGRSIRWGSLAVGWGGLAVAALGCATAAPAPVERALPGVSGMAAAGDGRFLVVHDAKTDEDGPRVGLFAFRESAPSDYRAIEIADWRDPAGRSHDLESVCALPGRPAEFLLAESGASPERRRLFHVSLRPTGGPGLRAGAEPEIAVLRVLPLPAPLRAEGDNYEGLACAASAGGRFLLLLGERGGEAPDPTGRIRFGTYDLARGSIEWTPRALAIRAPSPWPAATLRPIADLFVDADGALWAAATDDPGDAGPFRSIIYRVGRLDPSNGDDPLTLDPAPTPRWTIDAYKIESLSSLPNGALAAGSEDELLGGTFRVLPAN